MGFRGTVAVLNGQILSDSLEDTNNCLDLRTIVCITVSTKIFVLWDFMMQIVLDV